MIRFYNSRQLSQKLGVNLAKWKRWSREFLPPDPLGGLQSGYARQYNPNEAFTVYLAGHLVAELKFTVPEARQIINDLSRWLVEHKFYYNFDDYADNQHAGMENSRGCRIMIFNCGKLAERGRKYAYQIREIQAVIKIRDGHSELHQATYAETVLSPDETELDSAGFLSGRVLQISMFRELFLSKLQRD